MMSLRFRLMMLCLMLSFMPVMAQSDEKPAVITADNVATLQSVAQIDFSEGFTTGWFAMTQDGSQLAVAAQHRLFYWTLSDTGEYVASSPVELSDFAPLDMQFSDESQTVAVLNLGEQYQIFAGSDMSPLMTPAPGIALSMWLRGQDVWLETVSPGTDKATVIIQYPALLDAAGAQSIVPVTSAYTPAGDAGAMVRIGRISPPYVVTSSETGIVKLWNLETGEIQAEVDNGLDTPSVFGNINAAATHLVWRDDLSKNLYLMDFAAGENHQIASLNGDYVQWFFLSDDASVILAVNQNFEPVVAAWDVATGERTVLGTYRQCNRPQPDMARLSRDGTTLVIGCDTGLDVWRIGQP